MTALASQIRKNYRKKIKAEKYAEKAALVANLEKGGKLNGMEAWAALRKLKQKYEPEAGKMAADSITCDDWVDHFKKVGQSNCGFDSIFQSLVEATVNRDNSRSASSDASSPLNKPILEAEVKKAIRSMKNTTSCSSDLVLPAVMKAGVKILAPLLTNLFNRILNEGNFPDGWRNSYITPIPKKGDKSLAENYRDIAITSNFSKVLTRLLNTRLDSFCENNTILCDNQAGFRKFRRTTDNIFILRTLIDKALKEKRKLYLCFVDFKTAFPSVWRAGLFFKLEGMGISGKFLVLLKSMYASTDTFIKLPNNRGITHSFQLHKGLRQGCNLSPLLFNLMVNDLVEVIQLSNSDPPFIGATKSVSCLMYADDLVLISQNSMGLQNAMDSLQQYCMTWQFTINNKKTQVLVVSSRGKMKLSELNFHIGDSPIETVKSYTYLGLHLTNTGNHKATAHALTVKASYALSILQHYILHECLSVPTSLQLFRTLIVPILTYGSEIWGPENVSDNHCFEKVQLRFARFLLGVSNKTSNVGVRGELGLFPISIDIKLCTVGFWKHILLQQSALVWDAYQSTIQERLPFGCKIEAICQSINSPYIWNEQLATGIDRKCFLQYLSINYVAHWTEQLQNPLGPSGKGNKMRTYAKFKQTFCLEKYILKAKQFRERQIICRFRISNHKLDIEVGRHHRPPIPADLRVCTRCKCGKIGDENHYVFECIADDDLRLALFADINKDKTLVDTSGQMGMLRRVLSPEDTEEIHLLACFLKNAVAAK